MGISLDQINSEVERRYAPFVVEDVPGGDVAMLSPLRMPKPDRNRLLEMNDSLKAAQKSNDVQALLGLAHDVVRLVSVGKQGDRLLKAIGDDLAKLMYVLEQYMEAVQLGEVSRSEG